MSKDLAVIAFTDGNFKIPTPTITTVSQSIKMGNKAAKMLIERL
jgi:DNA-binding LacI/PurR family transcriptional regulator